MSVSSKNNASLLTAEKWFVSRVMKFCKLMGVLGTTEERTELCRFLQRQQETETTALILSHQL